MNYYAVRLPVLDEEKARFTVRNILAILKALQKKGISLHMEGLPTVLVDLLFTRLPIWKKQLHWPKMIRTS